MIRKLKIKSLFLTVASLFLVSSCEKEDLALELENPESSTGIYKIETISHKDALSNSTLSKTFNEVSSLLSPVGKSGTYYDVDNEFYIYTDEVKHITVDDYESFTYSIKTNPEEKAIKNLFFSKVAKDEYKSFLVTYDISDKTADEIMMFGESGKNPYINTKEIQTGFTTKIETSGDCTDVETEFICTMEDGSIKNFGESYSGGCTGSLEYVTTISIDMYCVSGGGGGGGNTGGADTGGNDGSGYPGGGNIGGGGGGGGTCTNCPPPDSGDDNSEPTDPDDNNDNGNDQPVECLAVNENGYCLGDITILKPEPAPDPQEPDNECKTSATALKKVFPRTPDDVIDELVEAINQHGKDFGIDTKEKLQHFLAQAGHESTSVVTGIEFGAFEENLNYRVKRIGVTDFTRYFNPWTDPTEDPDKKNPFDYERSAGSVFVDSEKLANYVYDDQFRRFPVGNIEIGDGYKYRGRGIIQLTGRNNYTDFSDFYRENYDSDTNLLENPDIVSDNIEIGVIAALWYFKNKVLANEEIDAQTSVLRITKLVNGGKKGITHRRDLTTKAKTEIECI